MRIALAFAILLIPFLSPAQEAAASLTGTLVDPAGDYIRRAPVELASETESFKVQTDNAGVYQFASLPAGEYKLRFLAMGFQTLTLTSVVLKEGEQKRIQQVTLDVGLIADCGRYPPAFHLIVGETVFGSLAGSVDEAGGVEVTLVCRTFTPCASTRTNSKGLFSFKMLSPGEYGLTFRRQGFYPEGATGYAFLVKAGLESVYAPVALERCPNGNCDPKLRPQKALVVCE